MSNRAEIATEVRRYIAAHYLHEGDEVDLKDDTPLLTGGVLDSFSALKMVVHLEELYGVTIYLREFALDSPDCGVDSIRAIAEMVESKLKSTKRSVCDA